MDDEMKYDTRFIDHILVVGQTGCEKTTFVQNLGKNRIFDDVNTVDWVSKIQLFKNRERQLRRTFSDASIEFHYPEDLSEFDILLESFREEEIDNNSYVNNIAMGENRELDKLIVMDDVSGLADKSN